MITRQDPASSVRSQTESIAPALTAYSAVFLLVNVVVVALRFYVRLGVIQKFGSDDLTLGLTLVSFPQWLQVSAQQSKF